jgi:hypothetical protein
MILKAQNKKLLLTICLIGAEMKIAITGHTSGIGKALFERVDNAVGFSLTSGYNITDPVKRADIVNNIYDCDVFINNAFDRYGQCEMLFDVWKSWKDTNKIIINIGSNVTKYIQSPKRLEMLDYYNYKISLKNLHERLQNLNTSVNMHYISFGYVATEKTKAKNIPERMMLPIDNAVTQITELYT